ncbi:MAG TPA: UDP-N-acetylmuramoyl-L-alanine--D-glutamate ligase, partial [Actinomycetota bacterium]|nr:UDP-N-acetylmuramoyl-L-alanine--D-glutamate ligase [Actinomycetota bacterium]
SSFQLETSSQFHPKVAVLLNIAEDHTDWHGSVESYVRAKARITMNQDHEDVFVYNADDDACVKIAASSRARLIPFSATRVPRDGAGYSGGSLVCGGTEVVTCADVPLSGKAGLEDVAAAAAAAIAYGVDVGEVAAAVRGFRPLAHRLELIAELSEVSFFDDSKATNPHATTAAVQGTEDVVLIAGGRSKGMDLSVLAKVVPPVRAVVAMGEAADEVVKVFDGLVDVRRASNMEEAVAHAYDMAKGRGSVLLSPGCASLDMYESYAARGEHFARCVRQLAGEQREREDSHGDA